MAVANQHTLIHCGTAWIGPAANELQGVFAADTPLRTLENCGLGTQCGPAVWAWLPVHTERNWGNDSAHLV